MHYKNMGFKPEPLNLSRINSALVNKNKLSVIINSFISGNFETGFKLYNNYLKTIGLPQLMFDGTEEVLNMQDVAALLQKKGFTGNQRIDGKPGLGKSLLAEVIQINNPQYSIVSLDERLLRNINIEKNNYKDKIKYYLASINRTLVKEKLSHTEQPIIFEGIGSILNNEFDSFIHNNNLQFWQTSIFLTQSSNFDTFNKLKYFRNIILREKNITESKINTFNDFQQIQNKLQHTPDVVIDCGTGSFKYGKEVHNLEKTNYLKYLILIDPLFKALHDHDLQAAKDIAGQRGYEYFKNRISNQFGDNNVN